MAEQTLAGMLNADRPVPPFVPAVLLVVMGRSAEASRWFDEVIRLRDWHLLVFRGEPLLRGVADDPIVPEACRALQLPAWPSPSPPAALASGPG